MKLQMRINKMLIDWKNVDFTGLSTVEERTEYLRELAFLMYGLHIRKVIAFNREPVFFIDRVESEMNYERENFNYDIDKTPN